MKAVLISIQPKWFELIANSSKTIEIRKAYPRRLLEEYYEKESDFFRNRPSYRVKPFKCYIYCTKGTIGLYKIGDCVIAEKISVIQVIPTHSGKVIGEFVCDSILDIPSYVGSYEDYQDYDISDNDLAKTCLGQGDLFNYGRGKPLYGWHIFDLVIYDKPKELSEFWKADICKHYDGGCDCWSELCKIAQSNDCHCGHTKITRPPQSWCYVEHLEAVRCVET